MLRYLKPISERLTYTVREAYRRPRTTAALVGLVLATLLVGAVLYAQQQWKAAKTALEAGNPHEALARLRVCLLLWPRDLETNLLAARAVRLTGDVKAAEERLQRCLTLHGAPTEEVQLEFLLLRVQTGEVDEVAPALMETVEKGHADSALILETVARAYITRLRYNLAFGCLSLWVERSPDTPRPYQLRGWVLERMSHHKAALRDYHKALELDPDLFPVRLRVAEMLLEDMRAPEALPHLERLYKLAPTHPAVLARLGTCRFLQNQPKEARRLLEAAEEHMPNDPVLLIPLAKLDLQDGRGAEAERRLRKALRQDAFDTEALYNLASALQMQRKTDESAETLKVYKQAKADIDRANKLLKEVGDSPTATAADYAEIGELLLRIDRANVGLYWLERALERDPGHRPAHKALAGYYEKKGDAAKAAAHRLWLSQK
jgi:tetratricopeptide (TPR) repeat protein